MKGLFQSKKFRNNLKKWLFMYVGTLCLLTSVITYSKYMSQVNGRGSIKVAKFNVSINFKNKCEGQSSVCSYDATRPLEQYEFEFTVDTSQLETAATVTVTPTIVLYKDRFTISEIYEINGNNQTRLNSIIYDVTPGVTENKHFKVVVDHTITVDEESQDKPYDKILNVGFSAIQKD